MHKIQKHAAIVRSEHFKFSIPMSFKLFYIAIVGSKGGSRDEHKSFHFHAVFLGCVPLWEMLDPPLTAIEGYWSVLH